MMRDPEWTIAAPGRHPAQGAEWGLSPAGWMISPEHLDDVAANLRSLQGLEATPDHGAGGSFWPDPGTYLSRLRPYEVANGVLTIPVRGTLLNHFPYTLDGAVTGYEYIREAVRRGISDEGVRAIVLDVDSPGGVVSGCFDTSDEIHAARGTKPIVAACNEFAFSAAYAIASAADSITVPRTGGVGSIGVVGTHIDLSKMFDDMGVKFNFIFAGKRKIDGRPDAPLSEAARTRMQSRIDATYKIFVETVARNRGMEVSDVRGTEAEIFTASESVKNGLADEIAPYIDAVAALSAAPTTNQRGDTMSKDKTAANQAAPTEATSAPVETGAAYTEADLSAARAEGAAAERDRITAIMAADEAESRPAAAKQVAFKTNMSVEDAKAFLSGLPAEKADAESTQPRDGGSAFEAAMSQGNPEIGAGAPESNTDNPDVAEGFFRSLGITAQH